MADIKILIVQIFLWFRTNVAVSRTDLKWSIILKTGKIIKIDQKKTFNFYEL